MESEGITMIVESLGGYIKKRVCTPLKVILWTFGICTKKLICPSLSCIRWHWMAFLWTRGSWSATTDQPSSVGPKSLCKLVQKWLKRQLAVLLCGNTKIIANLDTKVSVASWFNRPGCCQKEFPKHSWLPAATLDAPLHPDCLLSFGPPTPRMNSSTLLESLLHDLASLSSS